jgi:hypothetical protein
MTNQVLPLCRVVYASCIMLYVYLRINISYIHNASIPIPRECPVSDETSALPWATMHNRAACRTMYDLERPMAPWSTHVAKNRKTERRNGCVFFL